MLLRFSTYTDFDFSPIEKRNSLSAGDIEFVKSLYPAKPAVVDHGAEVKGESTLAPNTTEPGVARRSSLWPPGQITVQFLNGEEEHQRLVEKLAKEWFREGSLDIYLRFLTATSSEIGQIRIRFGDTSAWSYIGKDALTRTDRNLETMHLPDPTCNNTSSRFLSSFPLLIY